MMPEPARTIPSTIFNDPNYEGAADPEIVWNAHTGEWWIFYTARRMMAKENPGCGGTPIGVAASKNLIDWRFVGYCKFDGVGGDKDGPTTLWAPGIIAGADGTYHMFVTYKPSNGGPWGDGGADPADRGSRIRHYVAKDDLLNGWTAADPADLTPRPQSIDAGLFNENGHWLMVYRDLPQPAEQATARKGSLYWATSADGIKWDRHGQLPGDPNDDKLIGATYQEAPYVFKWKGAYWLIADVGPRLSQYRSDDLKTWKYLGPLLQNPGSEAQDKNSGKHPSVAVIGERAFIVYFNHPYKAADDSPLEKQRSTRSWLHVRELQFEGGKLAVDRDKPVTPPADVKPTTPNAGR